MSEILKPLTNGKFILAIGTVICSIITLIYFFAKKNKDYHNKAYEMVNNMIKSFADNKTERIDSETSSE
jgi:hypothetical protein